MDHESFEDLLVRLLEREAESEESNIQVLTFREAGIATWNKGLVARFEDGSEYQITIVQSKEGDPS